jgi:hypothetical protein
MSKTPLILSIDFDQTVAKVPHFPHIDGLRKGARKYINKLYNEGYYIIINTCRTDKYEKECYDATEAISYLYDNGIKYHKFNENHKQLMDFFDSDSRKISADIYVDDKGMWLFGIPSWFILYWMIQWKNLFIKKRLLNLVK